jgi:hypothetical protein
MERTPAPRAPVLGALHLAGQVWRAQSQRSSVNEPRGSAS